jgi:hypothetical protein
MRFFSRVLHLVLFIFACIAVHKWRRLQYPQNPQIIYVQQPPMQQMMIAQPGSGQAGGATLVPIPQGQTMSLPPPPPGMAYLVPIPQQEQQQQQEYPAVAHAHYAAAEPTPTQVKGDEFATGEIPELSARYDR